MSITPIPAPTAGTSVAPPLALFEVFHPGDNLNPTLAFDGTTARIATPSGVEYKSVTTMVFNAPAAGTFELRRCASENDGDVTLRYSEVAVASMDGTNRIIANPDNGVVAIPDLDVSTIVVIPLTDSWDVVGTDLTVSGGHIVTAAGGDFLITTSLQVIVTDPT